MDSVTCQRCGIVYNEPDYDPETYEEIAEGDDYCPECGSCQICPCCPCGQDNCLWCGENVAYRKIRAQLLLWSSAYNRESFQDFKKEPQRLMAELRKTYYRDGGCYTNDI